MEFKELFFKIMRDNNFTFEEMGKRLSVSNGLINDIEKGKKKVSKKMYEKLLKVFPSYRKEIERSYLKQVLPENVVIEKTLKEPEKFKIPVYGLASAGSGEIDMEYYVEEEFLLPANYQLPRGGFILQIHGDSMEPILFDGDRVVVNPNLCPSSIEGWKSLNRSIVVVMIENRRYAKKIIFRAGKMYLYSFNEDLYPEYEVKKNEDVYCIGVIDELIKRNMRKIKF